MERNSTAGFVSTSTGRRRDQRRFLTSRTGEMTGMVEASGGSWRVTGDSLCNERTGRRSIWIEFWRPTAILPHRCRLECDAQNPSRTTARNFLFQMEQNSTAVFALT